MTISLMTHHRLRPTLLLLLVAWLGIIAFAGYLLIAAQLSRWSGHFDEDVQLMAGQVKQKLDANEAVLAGFSAFLHAVDRSDTESTMRYAASAASAYPHIYMIEVARKVAPAEQAGLEAALRKGWRADFSIRDFGQITGRGVHADRQKTATWPILFMYPSLPEAQAIYGICLETVDYLAQTVALAGNNKPVVSPVFDLYEGDSAYILLQKVTRPAATASATLNFFGNTMIALLVIKTQALVPNWSKQGSHDNIEFSARLASAANPGSRLFEHKTVAAGKLDQLFLPKLSRQLKIDSLSQPTVMQFSRQVRWQDLLSPETVTMLVLLGAALFAVPWVTVRHYLSLDQAEQQHERAAYLATHDLLTGLPNRFLFADRFEQARLAWHRNGVPFALLLIDLDHFKEINDRHGHEIGDQVLVATGKHMVGELRGFDTVARHGGDEFIILLANIQNADDASAVGEKLLAAVAQPIETSAGPQSVACSIGISLCPIHGETLDVLRRSADRAMYQAKKGGRNAVSVFSDEMTETQYMASLAG